ncbi:MAG: enoyl-CoA hydratase/isomerase family protein [Rubricella sp.]
MIRWHEEQGIAWITLADPDRHNALDFAGIAALQAAFQRIGNEGSARVVVLTGEGKSFCAGARLDSVGQHDWTENPFVPLAQVIEDQPQPVICALNGSVFGAGVDVALACDFRIGREGMRAAVPAAELGIHYPSEGIARAVRKLGPQVARRVFLTAETFDAEALLRVGYLDALVPPDSFETEVKTLADRLAALAPLAVQGMKQSLRSAERGDEDDAALDRIRDCFRSADHAEGLAAKREKRKPVFRGA